MNQLRFRTRLVLILSLFAIVPALVLTLLWSGTVSTALPFVTGRSAWDSVAASGEKAIAAARQAPLTPSQRRAIDAHERELRTSVEQARRYSFLAARTVRVIAIAGVLALLVLTGAASRVAGHLSRQLSRPLDELVRWTELIGHGESLPPPPASKVVSTPQKNGDGVGTTEVTTSRVKGAPEFETLRRSMREMVSELAHGRQQAIEAERLHAFRETARRVAHEIKNPLTPIRFALARLRGHAPPQLQEDVDVIEIESERLDRMAKSFAEFGKLPEGPPAEIDMSELVRYTARSCVPPSVALDLEIDENLPRVHGHNGALAGALSNVLLNAVDASTNGGRIRVKASEVSMGGRAAVRISVADTGKGIAPDSLDRIWEPYVTNKPGGTGLGLSIARQAVWAHDGTVNATSTLGQGTEIQLTIPADGGSAARKI
ncbi:MAG TPA: HAMP domain-containing sensor histidine kinase [Gemmatimonadaceae bacterium]|nr:HAMP domain-containing sensor histidine kinase [Gemmatimonadaceae bacterium]